MNKKQEEKYMRGAGNHVILILFSLMFENNKSVHHIL
jgi:hypothetical protein